MKDLQSQLSAKFGVPLPEPEDPLAAVRGPAAADPAAAPILADGAWREDPWAQRLRALHRSLPGAPKLSASPSLGQQRQVTDQLVKILKKADRRRDARELAQLRDGFMGKRDKAAWSAVKTRFGELELSDKAYRRLKQEGAEPTKLLERLQAGGGAALQGLSARRLVEALRS